MAAAAAVATKVACKSRLNATYKPRCMVTEATATNGRARAGRKSDAGTTAHSNVIVPNPNSLVRGNHTLRVTGVAWLGVQRGKEGRPVLAAGWV